jgi:integrase
MVLFFKIQCSACHPSLFVGAYLPINLASPKYYRQLAAVDMNSQRTDKANVGPYRLHDLRHTFNTNMRKAGVDQVVIMKITGHKTNEMFLRYSHIDKEQGERAMEKLNGLLSSKNGKTQLVGSE